ncbi:LysR family transcriptional regulator [Agrobacterium vitis]|uniref:HTH-type transcriptional regulator TtuA n=2 Tax=Agrobacterium vitis TaxID=373 RepID=A0AAE2UT64_AGRVI|nr:LysR family transcriptional regulator [Agrobacterium vitis]
MINLRSLEVFYWVSTLQNFGQAAARLYMTQPAVSQRISTLEEEFGCRLLERSARTVQLTPKGRHLLAYADRLLLLHSEMIREVAAADHLSGVLRLGVSETIVQTWLPDFIDRVSRVYPAVTFDIEVDVTPKMKASLLKHELDLAFLMGPVAAPDFVDVPLNPFALAFICNSQTQFNDEVVSAEMLQKYALITYQKNTANYRELQQLFRTATSSAPRIHASSSLATIIRMTLSGLGIAVIPPAAVEPELRRGELRILSTPLNLNPLRFTASYRLGPGTILAPLLAQIAVETSSFHAGMHNDI